MPSNTTVPETLCFAHGHTKVRRQSGSISWWECPSCMSAPTPDLAKIGAALLAAIESLPDGEIVFKKGAMTAYLYGTAFRNTEIRALDAALRAPTTETPDHG
jgi:hypothetical protein